MWAQQTPVEESVLLAACKDVSSFLDSNSKNSRKLLSSSLSGLCVASYLLGCSNGVLLSSSGSLHWPLCCARVLLDKSATQLRISNQVASCMGPTLMAATLQTAGRAFACLRRHAWILTAAAQILTGDNRLGNAIEVRLALGQNPQIALNRFVATLKE